VRVLVTGASGLVGQRLAEHLQGRWHEVIATSRHPRAHEWPDGVEAIQWDGERHLRVGGPLHGVVNLAGASILERRWTDARKAELIESRVRLTRHLANFINGLPKPRPVLVSASAVGAYGNASAPVDESSPFGDDFLARLCRQWEEAALEAQTRVVILRFGNVMDPRGGYLGKLLPLLRWGVAGPLGPGDQKVPWIHHHDLTRAITWALEEERAHGVYNAVAGSVDNATLVKTAAKTLRRPAILKAPAWALRARFGEGVEAITGGQDVKRSRLREEGFTFEHDVLEPAMQDLLKAA
jgi:uncharacterized protein